MLICEGEKVCVYGDKKGRGEDGGGMGRWGGGGGGGMMGGYYHELTGMWQR